MASVLRIVKKEYALTNREIEIMDRISDGLLNKEIADELNPCVNTVRAHVRNILNKLGVKNRTEATNKYKDILEKNRIFFSNK
ncbi:MAG: LuxR C-terminal-related transcriptional regulator [Bacteroidales bacterium]